MNINEPFYLISWNEYILDTESPNLEKTPPYDFYFPFSRWEEGFRVQRFLGKNKEFFEDLNIQKTILSLFPLKSRRN